MTPIRTALLRRQVRQISPGRVRFGSSVGGGGYRAAAARCSGQRWRARASWRRLCGSGPAAQRFLGRLDVWGDRAALAWALLAWALCSAAGRSRPPSAPSSAPSRLSGRYYYSGRSGSVRLLLALLLHHCIGLMTPIGTAVLRRKAPRSRREGSSSASGGGGGGFGSR